MSRAAANDQISYPKITIADFDLDIPHSPSGFRKCAAISEAMPQWLNASAQPASEPIPHLHRSSQVGAS